MQSGFLNAKSTLIQQMINGTNNIFILCISIRILTSNHRPRWRLLVQFNRLHRNGIHRSDNLSLYTLLNIHSDKDGCMFRRFCSFVNIQVFHICFRSTLFHNYICLGRYKNPLHILENRQSSDNNYQYTNSGIYIHQV